MGWDNLIDLILNSIQIIGVFIAIVIGLIISKVMDLKKEKNEVIDIIEDINNELENMNKQFEKLKEDNYKFYKEDNVYSMIDLIFDGKECEISYSIPHISEQDQKDFYEYVKKYINKVIENIDKNTLEQCKKKLKVEKNSIEEMIIDEIYERGE